MTMTFSKSVFADISTKYFAKTDLPLLLDKDAPYHLANEDDGNGSFFFVPDDPYYFEEEMIPGLKTMGFSDRFLEVVAELFRQGIRYVRFEGDGDDIEGLEVHPDFDERELRQEIEAVRSALDAETDDAVEHARLTLRLAELEAELEEL